MSIIVPAGNRMGDWSPKAEDSELVKTASTEAQEATEEVANDRDGLYEAAEKALKEAAENEKQKKEAQSFFPCEDGPCEDVVEVTEVTPMSEESPFETEDTEVSEVVEEGEESEAAAVETVEEAVEAVVEAVEDLKEVVDVEEGDEVAEIEIEVEEDAPFETSEPTEEIEDINEENEEIVVESEETEAKPCCESCGASLASAGIEMSKSASSDQFIKIANLSPSNRKKIADYWVRMLGYPRDYVNLLVKDYE